MKAREYNEHRSLYVPKGELPEEFPSDYTGDPDQVREIQKKANSLMNDEIAVDGYMGPSTIRSLARIDRKRRGPGITIGPKVYPVDERVPEVVHMEDIDREATPSESRKGHQDLRQAVIHYDVAYDMWQAHQTLQKRGLSVHFMINYDGTLFQPHNPALSVCYHEEKTNNHSIGIEMNNPADPKFQENDLQHGSGEKRPIKTDHVHGRDIERLDYFPEQIYALDYLIEGICDRLDIPRRVPREEDGPVRKEVIENEKEYKGILGHYHLDSQKTDPSPLKWEEVMPFGEPTDYCS